MDSNSSSAVTMVKTPTPPKTIYGDRFWSSSNSSTFSGSSNSYSGKGGGGGPPLPEFDSNNQRIECAENGKSYLQLGTVGHQQQHHPHHHLPVPPVAMQPKTSHMVSITHLYLYMRHFCCYVTRFVQ